MRISTRIALIIALTAGLAGAAAAGGTADKKAAEAPPAACEGTNLLTALASSDPARHARILEDADTLENGRAVLWRLERPGLAPSYLFGTVHLTDTRVTQLSDATRLALDGSTAVLLEAADVSPETTARALTSAARAAVFTDGRSLESLLSEEEFRKVEASIDRVGVPAAAAKLYRPWIVSMLLAASDCERRRIREGEAVLDMVVADRAKARAIPVAGLETTEEQLAAMAGVPEDQQVGMLRANLALADQTDDLMETMVQLYLERRIGAVWGLQIALAEKAGIPASAFAAFQEQIVVGRNRKMRDVALPYLEKGGAFVAVGALHLPGKDGLVALFRDAGYTATAIE